MEADQAAGQPLLWLGDDQAVTAQDPPDRRDRRHSAIELLGEMVRDRVRAGVVTFGLEPLAHPDDRLHDLLGRSVLAGSWASGAGLQCLIAALPIAS